MAAKPLAEFPSDWWNTMQGEWDAHADPQSYAMLMKAMNAAQKAIRARDQSLKAYKKRLRRDTKKAFKAYVMLSNARAAQYAAMLEQYQAQIDAVDETVKASIRSGKNARTSLRAIRKSLDGAASAATQGIENRSKKKFKQTLQIANGFDVKSDETKAIYEGIIRELNEILASREAPVAQRPAKPGKKKNGRAKKRRAKKD